MLVEQFGNIHYARFIANGMSDLEVDNLERIVSQTISPKSYKIASRIEGTKTLFSLNGARQIIIKTNSKNLLFIFAEQPELDVPDLKASNVINFASYVSENRDQNIAVTQELQSALNAASARGGNTATILYIPDGKYMIGQITLKSNVHLYLSAGALLKAVVANIDTPTYPLQGVPGVRDSSLIYVYKATNARIY
jgi:hypothetical protein